MKIVDASISYDPEDKRYFVDWFNIEINGTNHKMNSTSLPLQAKGLALHWLAVHGYDASNFPWVTPSLFPIHEATWPF